MARVLLQNGCAYTAFNVFPKNWKTAAASTKKAWYITYRYIDPAHRDRWPNGYQVMVKNMNSFAEPAQRRAATAQILEELKQMLEMEGYNPITAQFEQPSGFSNDYIISPESPICEALEKAAGRLKVAPDTAESIAITVRKFREGAAVARLEARPVKEFGRRHVIAVLDAAEKLQGSWSASRFNKHRTNLIILWNELLNVEAVEANPVTSVKTRKEVKKIREILSAEERLKVNEFLHAHYPAFWRFLHIFFHSGARESELMRLQGKHVNLARQEAKYLVKKGDSYEEKLRPIKDLALPFWVLALEGCGPEDFVFAKGLTPGPVAIDSIQIAKRWRAHIKGKKQSRSTGKNKSTMPRLGIEITADFYSLKHSNLTELRKMLSREEAARAAGHTSTKMLDAHYDVAKKEDDFARIRKAGNRFA